MKKSNLGFISFMIIVMVSLRLLSPIEANAANKNVTLILQFLKMLEVEKQRHIL